jgi:hypothetical protein
MRSFPFIRSPALCSFLPKEWNPNNGFLIDVLSRFIWWGTDKGGEWFELDGIRREGIQGQKVHVKHPAALVDSSPIMV